MVNAISTPVSSHSSFPVPSGVAISHPVAPSTSFLKHSANRHDFFHTSTPAFCQLLCLRSSSPSFTMNFPLYHSSPACIRRLRLCDQESLRNMKSYFHRYKVAMNMESEEKQRFGQLVLGKCQCGDAIKRCK